MKKTVSVILCLVMILTAFPFSFTAGAENKNPLKEIQLSENETLFLDKYYVSDSKELTVTLVGEIENEEVTDVVSVEWRTLDPETVSISVNQDDNTKVTISAESTGSVNIVAEVTTTGGTSFSKVCKVTVRESIKTHIDSFELMMDEIPADVDDIPAKYSSASMTQLKNAFGEILAYFSDAHKYETYALRKAAILTAVGNMKDTEKNCLKIDNWKTSIMTVAASLNNSVLAQSDDDEFWAKWNTAYGKIPEDVAVAYALLPEKTDTSYTEDSVKPVFKVLAKFKKEWLKTEKDDLDALAGELEKALGNLKKHTTVLKFESSIITKDYGAGTFKIPYTVTGYDEIEWSSTDEKIATVTQNGYVTIVSAIPEGYTKKIRIIAYSNGITESCELVIRNPIKSIKISERMAVLMGETKKLIVETTGTDNSCPITETPVFEYSCDNEEIAKIDKNGIITPKSTGKCNITVKIKNNNVVESKKCIVTVAPSQKVTRLTVVGLPTQITVNAIAEAKIFVYPKNSTNKEIKWSSSNEKIAKVTAITTDENSYATATIKGISSGTCTITYEATDGSGIKGSFSLRVNPLVSRIMFDKTNIVTYVGNQDELKITATCQPVNAGNQKLSWFSSDNAVATVVDGKITVHATGSCTITAVAQDGSGKTRTADLLVLGTAKSIKITGAPTKMNTGDKKNLVCTVETKQGIIYNVKNWSVSDKKLAKISEDGVLEALRPGKVTVTAKYFDGTTATKTIKIIAPLNGISLPSTLTLAIGKTKTLSPTFNPEYASNKNVKWNSTDSSVASVSTSGTVYAAGTGTAIIAVKSEEGGYVAYCHVTVIKPVTGVTISKTSYTLKMGKAETCKLSATVSPADATIDNVSWSSDNTKVATVSSSGLVTAKGPGVAKITAKTADGGYTAVCKITVKQALKSIKFSSSTATYYVGQKKSLSVIFTPSNASNKGLTYKTSNKSIATVSAGGVVTAKKKGSCTITAISDDGGHKATCKLKVKAKTDVKEIKITRSTATVNAGKTKQLTATVYPDNASVKTVKWTSSDKSIASVNSKGVVTAHKGGTVTIKCTSSDTGVSDKCKITVYEKVTGIKISASSATLVNGKTKVLTAEVTPSTASNKSIKWYSTDKSIAKVSSSGEITAIKGGTCKIVAKSKDNSNVSAKCNLTVLQSPTKIKLSETDADIVKGNKFVLTATVKPKNCYDGSITWSSSNSSVARVSDEGIVTAVSVGTANITCRSVTDQSVKSVCSVTVLQPVTGVKLSAERVTLTTGRTKTLIATVSPSNASNKKVSFKTSDKNVVRVSSKGVVEAMGPGQATVTVKTNDGFYTAKCVFTVIEPVVSISLDKKSTSIAVGKSKTLIATVKPKNATNKDVVWRSSNPLVARVTQSGKVIALKEGTAVITCTTDDGGFKASCKVKCIIPVSALTLKNSELSLKKGSTKTLKAYVYPSDATTKDVTWKSSDTNVATVDKYGKIKAVKKGVCIITCTTKQGGKKATCILTVK